MKKSGFLSLPGRPCLLYQYLYNDGLMWFAMVMLIVLSRASSVNALEHINPTLPRMKRVEKERRSCSTLFILGSVGFMCSNFIKVAKVFQFVMIISGAAI